MHVLIHNALKRPPSSEPPTHIICWVRVNGTSEIKKERIGRRREDLKTKNE